MKKGDLTKKSSDDLVALFADLSRQQGDALIVDDTRRSNRLYYKMKDIDQELRLRGPEARLRLKVLFTDANPFVRLNAAVKILGLVPQEGRAVLQKIREARIQPEALHAGMVVLRFDSGEWVPD